MPQDWNDTTQPWQSPATPYKSAALPWNDPALPWKASAGTHPWFDLLARDGSSYLLKRNGTDSLLRGH